MNNLMNNLVKHISQCWGCEVFDNLFHVVSDAGAVVYAKIANICFALFAVLFIFYVVWAVWKTLNPKKPDTSDPMYTKTVVRVVINSIIVLTLLGVGVAVPRFVTRFTFEPVANITLLYTQSVLKATPEYVAEHVQSAPLKPMKPNGFYRPELRDTVINIMKTTIVSFQEYMNLGIAIIDKSFEWHQMPTISAIIQHIIYFILGLYILYGFLKIFVRFCFYFVDVIINMALFAFLFPIGLMMMSFRGAEMPEWMSSLGKGLGTNQLKKVIGSIVSLGASVITYLVVVIIIARFFTDSGTTVNELMDDILSGNVFASDLSDDNLSSITIASMVMLLYIANYIFSQIPQVSKMILETFGVTEENKMSEQLANDAEKLVSLIVAGAKNIGSKIVNKGENSKDGSSSSGANDNSYYSHDDDNTSNSNSIFKITLDPGDGGNGSDHRHIFIRPRVGWYSDGFAKHLITASIFDPTSSGGAGLLRPVKPNYTFTGYWTSMFGHNRVIDANGKILIDKPPFSSDTTLYAQWTQTGSNITLDKNADDATECIITSVNAERGAEMPVITCAPRRPGYAFDGYWDDQDYGIQYYNADLSSARNWDKTGDQTLYAHWKPETV